MAEPGKTRPVSWIKAALREFETFAIDAQSTFLTALTVAAEAGKADSAKPLHGLGSAVLRSRSLSAAMSFGSFMPSN
jgi:phage-related protein